MRKKSVAILIIPLMMITGGMILPHAFDIITDIMREQERLKYCCKSLMYVDVASVAHVNNVILQLCDKKIPFQKMTENIVFNPFRGDGKQALSAGTSILSWEAEVGWRAKQEPCALSIHALHDSGWKEYTFTESFSESYGILAGISYGFRLNQDNTITLLFWP